MAALVVTTPAASATQLTNVLTISQVAKMAGWTRSRMHRHLITMNQQLGGMLLCNVGRKQKPRWTITLAALQLVAPQWMHDPDSLQREQDRQAEEIVELQKEIVHLKEMVAVQTTALIALKRRFKQVAA